MRRSPAMRRSPRHAAHTTLSCRTTVSCGAHPCHAARTTVSCCAQSQHPERPVERLKPGVPGFRDYARNDPVEATTPRGNNPRHSAHSRHAAPTPRYARRLPCHAAPTPVAARSRLGKAIDQVRAQEARKLKHEGYEPILSSTRWLFLKRPEHLTALLKIKQRQ